MSPTQKAEIWRHIETNSNSSTKKQNKTNKKRHLKIQKCIHYLSCDQLLEKKQLKVCFGTWFEGIQWIHQGEEGMAVNGSAEAQSVVTACSHPSGTGSSENILNKEEMGNLCQGHEPVDLLPLVRSHFLKGCTLTPNSAPRWEPGTCNLRETVHVKIRTFFPLAPLGLRLSALYCKMHSIQLQRSS